VPTQPQVQRSAATSSAHKWPGTVVQFTGTGQGGSGTYEYRYRLKGPAMGGVWQGVQDGLAQAGYAWDTTGANKIQVQRRSAGTLGTPVNKTLNDGVN